MQTNALAPFGVEITGVDLRLAEQRYAVCTSELLAEHGVAVFRNQTLCDDAFVAFLRDLGELVFTRGEQPAPGAPDLNVVSNIGRTVPPRSVFHTDTSYIAQPPAYTALRPVMLPEHGGATLFSNQVAAYEKLPAQAQAALAKRQLRHTVTGLAGQNEARWQPLLRKHPVSGKTSLYLSALARCTHLSDLRDDDAQRVIALLYKRSIRPSALYRHRWRRGDIVIWDNRMTMHRADHSGVEGNRVFHRGMVAGEAPIPA